MGLYDIHELREAEARRNEALRRVDENTDDEWKRLARMALVATATENVILSPDDIWKVIEPPEEPRYLGPIMVWGSREGIIRKLEGCDTRSKRGHSPPVQVWISQLFDHCDTCDDHGFLWVVENGIWAGRFCDCIIGSDPDFRKYVTHLFGQLGTISGSA